MFCLCIMCKNREMSTHLITPKTVQLLWLNQLRNHVLLKKVPFIILKLVIPWPLKLVLAYRMLIKFIDQDILFQLFCIHLTLCRSYLEIIWDCDNPDYSSTAATISSESSSPMMWSHTLADLLQHWLLLLPCLNHHDII